MSVVSHQDPPDLIRYQLAWPSGQVDALLAIARGQVPGRSSAEPEFAVPILEAISGNFDDAGEHAAQILARNYALIEISQEAFISAAHALFVVQRLDLLAALLKRRCGFANDLAIRIVDPGPGVSMVRWEVSKDARHTFEFDLRSLADFDVSRLEILAFLWEFPLFCHCAASNAIGHGSIVINRADIGQTPGIAYCDSRPDYFLVPDCLFVSTNGYSYARQVFERSNVPWEDRKPVAMWRGATTGVPRDHNGWRSLERVQLCQIANSCVDLFDVGLSAIVQLSDPTIVEEVTNSGLMRAPIPWQEWNEYRYQIDIDGNSSPWSNLFQRLLTGSPVLKVESYRGLRQWYYDRLVPWKNYIPVAPDMWDLAEKVTWLKQNDPTAQAIGRAGREFALTMTYEAEMRRAVPIVAEAFRYFLSR